MADGDAASIRVDGKRCRDPLGVNAQASLARPAVRR
jgi:hypothetical protein